MSWDDNAFSKIVEMLDSEPLRTCVIRQEFLDEFSLDPQRLSQAATRDVIKTFEIREIPEKNMSVRDFVFVYAPKRKS